MTPDGADRDSATDGNRKAENTSAQGNHPRRTASERRSVLLRLDPAVHDALARWASDELRSVNAQIEITLRRALTDAGRAPRNIQPIRKPGRPRNSESDDNDGGAD